MKKVTLGNTTWDALYFKKGYYFVITKEELQKYQYHQKTLLATIEGIDHVWDVEVIQETSRVEHILKHMIEFNIHRFEAYHDELVSIRLYEKSAS